MDDGAVLPARHKLDVDAYYRMADAGIIAHDARIELIDGELIDMAPIGQGHASTVDRLTEALFIACQGRAIISVQNPVRLNQLNEPQPDLTVLRRRDDFYGTGNRAGPADVLLLIEVSDTSLRYDQTVKLPAYARAGIAEYWVVDLPRRAVIVHRQPVADSYADISTKGPGDQLALALAPEVVIALNLVFGPTP